MTKCYSFYSYKGGSGRTTAAVNTVRHLLGKMGISPERPLLLIDADLESAGLTYFFGLETKISGKFSDAVHTTKLLADTSLITQPSTFGKGSEGPRKLSFEILEQLRKLFGGADGEEAACFADITATRAEQRMFKHILECYTAQCGSGTTDFGANAEYTEIASNFDPARLSLRIKAIHNSDSLSAEEKVQQKRRAFKDFLPLCSFADISEHFGCSEGSVRFLGVDVRYKGEQIAYNGTDEQISNLIEACTKHNYAAVVFDCGAGTQSSAHVLHMVSDVMIYCMRPTLQFVSGTRLNLSRYYRILECSMDEKGKSADQKAVIILPTAVPRASGNDALCEESFAQIAAIVKDYEGIVDGTFCHPQKALCEVGLFKWREQILGVRPVGELKAEIRHITEQYAEQSSMPEDAKSAYNTYALLAERIIANS